jgi:uncharacterized protein YndB with AHSA1/START domain
MTDQSNNTADAITITRTFNAPRELVWRAWTEPEHFMRWWGPEHFTSPVAKMDLRVGGTYLASIRSPEGQDFYSTGVYREITPPERLVFTDAFADAEGNVVPASHYGMGDDWPAEILITVTFEEENGQTRMTVRQDGIPTGEMREGLVPGWNEYFDKLATALAGSQTTTM